MLDDLPKPVVFAHRGASQYAPENTIAAFELAVSQGADAIELDVKLSADGKAVVIHDQTVDRTTHGSGRVNQMTLASLKGLNAQYRFDAYAGEQIPTLDEVFESVGKRIFINVELTNYASRHDNLVPIVAEIVKRHQLEKEVLFSSFIPVNLKKMKTLLPDVPVALLASQGVLGVASRSALFTQLSPKIIHPYLDDVTPQLMNTERRRGRRVHVWTVNEDIDLRRMIDYGVDGFFTDDPAKALRILERK